MTSVLIPLAEGFEEIEAISIIDILRRADIQVTTAALGELHVAGKHGVKVEADTSLDTVREQDFDMIVLPGGPGATRLEADQRVLDLLRTFAQAGKFTAAICAAPKVLKAAGLLDGLRATSFPGVLDVSPADGMEYVTKQAVVKDGRVITSRGPGTAMDFALELVEVLAGSDVRERVEAALQR